MPVSFQQAFELHRTGRFAEAEIAYRAMLVDAPDNVELMQNLGLVMAQTGRLDQGLALLRDAVRRDPKAALAQYHTGSVLAALGRSDEALDAFDAALAVKPDLAEAAFAKGNLLFAQKQWEAAAEAFRRAAMLAPERPEAQLNLASVLQELGRLDEAKAACDAVLAIAPNHSGALNNRANLFRQIGDLDAALADCDAALAVAPDYALARFNRATVLNALRRFDEALSECDRLVARAPNYPPAHHLRGTVLLALYRFEEALDAFDRALALQPGMLEAFHGRIGALIKLTRWEEALTACDRAVQLEPMSPLAHNNRGVALLKFLRYDEAKAEFEQAIALAPQVAEGYFNRSGLYYQLRRLDDAFADTQRAFELQRDFVQARSFRFSLAANLCRWSDRADDVAAVVAYCRENKEIEPFPLLYAIDDPEIHLMAARKLAGKPKPAVCRMRATERKRLRVAYLSADFRDHPVSHQAAELFESHDPERVETYAISLWPQPPGAMSERMRKAFAHFVEVFDRSDIDVARRLADLQIDIAVDLGGYSDKGRPQVMAYRPAPVTVTYLGYPGSTGADYVDYLIADAVTVPPEDDRFFAEKIARLPMCFMPFDTTVRLSPNIPARAAEGLPDDGFVFANFNKTDKITPDVFDIWMHILMAVPSSVLWLNVANGTPRDNLRAEARARGVDPSRLIFAARREERADHLARLALADLFLDTAPYNAHATTSDFLAAGVPVLTSPGRTFASRVAASLLHQVGGDALIMPSLAAYRDEAIALANSPERLAKLRAAIVADARRPTDTKRLARLIENAYFSMWQRRLSGGKPESFIVPE